MIPKEFPDSHTELLQMKMIVVSLFILHILSEINEKLKMEG